MMSVDPIQNAQQQTLSLYETVLTDFDRERTKHLRVVHALCERLQKWLFSEDFRNAIDAIKAYTQGTGNYDAVIETVNNSDSYLGWQAIRAAARLDVASLARLTAELAKQDAASDAAEGYASNMGVYDARWNALGEAIEQGYSTEEAESIADSAGHAAYLEELKYHLKLIDTVTLQQTSAV